MCKDSLAGLLGIFDLLRRAMESLRPAWGWLKAGTTGPLLQHGAHTIGPEHLPQHLRCALEAIKSLAEDKSGEDDDRRRMYLAEIVQLRDSFVMAETRHEDWCVTLRFPMIVSEAFIRLVRVEDPMALVIMAHYCILLHRAPGRWWAKRCSIDVIINISQILNPHWRSFILLPLQAAELHGL